MVNNKIIGDRLRACRKEKGWTLEKASMKLNVDWSTLARWERGECRMDNQKLNRIARMYGVSVKELDPYAKEIIVSDVGKGQYIYQFEPGEKGWQVAKRAWKNSVSFRCLVVAVLLSEMLVIWTGLSTNLTVYFMSVVSVGAALLIGNSLWPAKKKLDQFFIKGVGAFAIIALVLIGVGI